MFSIQGNIVTLECDITIEHLVDAEPLSSLYIYTLFGGTINKHFFNRSPQSSSLPVVDICTSS